MNREETLRNLKKLRNPNELKLSTYQQYLEDGIAYIIQNIKKNEVKPEYVEVKWLQRQIIDDMTDGKCDGLVLRKLNYYIWLYEREQDAKR